MAKAGMKRPDPKEPHGTESNKKQKFPKNEQQPVPEIQGKGKAGHEKANAKDNREKSRPKNIKNKSGQVQAGDRI